MSGPRQIRAIIDFIHANDGKTIGEEDVDRRKVVGPRGKSIEAAALRDAKTTGGGQ